MSAREVNFDGLIGPTHHYGGLSPGNLASQQFRHQISSPRRAALQGLAKMKQVADLGITQAFLPPQRRPDLNFLRNHGFQGSASAALLKASRDRPDLLSAAYSASAMWTANAATISPSSDCRDGRVHITPANLQSMSHRRLEVGQTTRLLRQVFHDTRHFVVHDPLPSELERSDEGAANHTRFCRSYGAAGVELFVFGRDGEPNRQPTQFVARQSRAASKAIAGQHLLEPTQTVFAQQHPAAIDAGVFHNDVIAVGNQMVHLVHACAFWDQPSVLEQLQSVLGDHLQTIEISSEELTLHEAVRTYFFNSQLLTGSNGEMLLLCPVECQESERAARVIKRLLEPDNPITDCQFVDLRESMRNGGGPACLRLRVVLTDDELNAIPPALILTEDRYEQLCDWVQRHYREHLTVEDLADPLLFAEVSAALDELDSMLAL